MKKFFIVAITIMCFFGCGKKEMDTSEKKGSFAELKQAEEHEFIKSEQGFIVHMKDIKVLMKHLSSSINKEDWEAIKEDTKKLKNASPVAFTGSDKKTLPVEFVNLDVQFHLNALELVGACQEKNKDKAMAAFFKVVNGCDECHAKYNPKETSASWFH
ncbi:MAG: hypothetical protein MRJ65_03165 [Candidatus Brocadiaceae bacterium]|nr:hypothetical protein [Candidatus Brocadiaceae bacterium]